MSSRLLAAVLVLFVTLLPACDNGSGAGDGLEARFFVGTWTLVQVRDASGDRTAEVEALVDDFRIVFASGSAFTLTVDYAAAVNAAGTPDATITGTYAISSGGRLVLTQAGNNLSASFGVTQESDRRVRLATDALVANGLLAGSTLDLGLTGAVALSIARA